MKSKKYRLEKILHIQLQIAGNILQLIQESQNTLKMEIEFESLKQII